MKKVNAILSMFLMFTLVLSLCACGGSSGGTTAESATVESEAEKETSEAEKTESAVDSKAVEEKSESSVPADITEASKPEKAETAAEFPIGEYHTFAEKDSTGFICETNMDTGKLILEEDGTGSIDYNGYIFRKIDSWTKEGDEGTIVFEPGDFVVESEYEDGEKYTIVFNFDDPRKVVYGDGVIILDVEDLFIEDALYFAQEGADTSGYGVLTYEEYAEAKTPSSKLTAYEESLDWEAGVHFDYEWNFGDGSVFSYDVNYKPGLFYCRCDTSPGSNITLAKDGIEYNLSPRTMKGYINDTYEPDEDLVIQSLVYNRLYELIWHRARELQYKTETRELDGVTYDVEIFPETTDDAEAAFYFDESGKLIYVETGVSPSESDLGEQNYKINAIDNAVDDSSFDILSEYTIYESFDEWLAATMN